MKNFPGTRQPVRIRVNDHQTQDTRYTQVAECVGQGFLQPPHNGYQAEFFIQVEVTLHASHNGEVGEPLNLRGYPVRLVANNNTIMGPPTEANPTGVLAIRNPALQIDADWAAVCARYADDDTAYLQGDAFEYAMKNGPVILTQLIEQHMYAAQFPPFSRYTG
ncbi:hypothetical protein [Hymenobacter algoricola]|uniref:Uncharacterized protein n=1 Tax=Hymenobacter algoricola TaxID=486267 RepID=A0ABP7NAX2_9BACT